MGLSLKVLQYTQNISLNSSGNIFRFIAHKRFASHLFIKFHVAFGNFVYARDLLSDQLRPDVLSRLEDHRRAGHEVLFVSASLVYYLEPLADLLGVCAVLAVEPAQLDGRLTGELVRPNVRAEQKALRLREWLGAPADGPVEGTRLWGYGNSSGDHELLQMSDHAFWLGRPNKVPSGAKVFVPGPIPD